jgi:hypothetical protein
MSTFGLILLVLLIVILMGGFGRYQGDFAIPGGIVGLLLVILVILMILGRI